MGVRGRGLCGVANGGFCSRPEHFDWLAEQILSMCEFCIEFRLCFSDSAELDKTCSEKTSVRWGGRALPKESKETFRSKAEHSVCPAERILSKCVFCVEFCLCSVDVAELGKTCSDKISLRWERKVLPNGSKEIFRSKAEHSNGSAEQMRSECNL